MSTYGVSILGAREPLIAGPDRRGRRARRVRRRMRFGVLLLLGTREEGKPRKAPDSNPGELSWRDGKLFGPLRIEAARRSASR
jgi:hypothetical protein